VGVGYYAGWKATGTSNVFIGDRAARVLAAGNFNVAIGSLALEDGTGGDGNVVVGANAGQNSITTGDYNTVLGYGAQYHNTAGFNPTKCIVLGANARSSANNQCVLGGSGENAVDLVVGGPVVALGQGHFDQASSTAAQPVLYLDQADVSEEFARFVGAASTAALTQSIVAEVAVTTASRAGWLKIYVTDAGGQIAATAYYMPIYTLA
jgi:hypothetical protein